MKLFYFVIWEINDRVMKTLVCYKDFYNGLVYAGIVVPFLAIIDLVMIF